MRVTLSGEALRIAGLFEKQADVTVKDCLVDDEYDRVIIVVKAGEMAKAIGPGGETVRRVQERLGKRVKLVEDAATPEDFVANALAPAAVYTVTVSETDDDRVASAEVAAEDRGAAIGSDGNNIDAARRLAKRHHDIDDIELS